MIELTRTNDPVLLSWLTCRLEQGGIECVVFDTHTSILEGSIGAIPRRVMVLEEQESQARHILDQAPCQTKDNIEIGDWYPDPVKSS